MGEVSQISEFGKIFVFVITGFVLVALTLFAGRITAPNNPNPEKLSSYECGEEPTGNAWLPFNSRFYVIALVFLLFDVEMVFIIPWATIFGNHDLISADARWGKLAFTEMFIFIGVLILGLIYVWQKGDLEWIKPEAEVPHSNTNIPFSLYNKLNDGQSGVKLKEFSALTDKENTAVAAATISSTAAATATPVVRKPMFKPTFKKPGDAS